MCVGVVAPNETDNNISWFAVNSTAELVGCRYPAQAWCTSVPKIYFFQYILALALIAIGYPIASVMCYSIYSKILGPHKQVYIIIYNLYMHYMYIIT